VQQTTLRGLALGGGDAVPAALGTDFADPGFDAPRGEDGTMVERGIHGLDVV
jgi:hypothetical protein